MDISPLVLKFGRLDMGSKAVERYITIRNLSSCATKIIIDTGSNLPNMVVAPTKSRVRPQGTLIITVRLFPIEEGDIYKELWYIINILLLTLHTESLRLLKIES